MIPGTKTLVSSVSPRGQALMLACWWIELLLLAGGLALIWTVSVWVGVGLIALGAAYAVVVIPRVRMRLGFNRYRGGWQS